MTHFSYDANKCRIDFFKPSGKWYSTAEVEFRNSDWAGKGGTPIHTALYNAIEDAGLAHMLNEFDCICLEPYHEFCHPICIKHSENIDEYEY